MARFGSAGVIVDSSQILAGVIQGSDIANNAVVDANIGAHTTTKITVPTSLLSGTVGTSQIADNAVTLDKLADGTQGDILYFGASGAPTLLAAGTAGTALKTNGAGQNPSWGSTAASFFVPLTSAASATTEVQGNFTSVNMAAAGTTSGYCCFYMPSGTIQSVQLLARATSSSSGDVVLAFSTASAADNTINTFDGDVARTFSDFSSTVNYQLISIPSADYDGLTQGVPWAIRVDRLGDNGSDTLGVVLHAMGILINL